MADEKHLSWSKETVDPADPFARFLPKGKPWYKSECPYYQGYWVHGGIGSVQCAMVDHLIPGLRWYLICGKRHEKCPFNPETKYETKTMEE